MRRLPGGALGGDLPNSEELASELGSLLEELKGEDLAPEVFRRRLRSLLHHRAHATAVLLRQFESEDEERLALAISALKALDDPSIIPHLLKLLRAPRVGALAKGLVLNLLEWYGFDTRDPSLIGASIDLEEALKGSGPPESSR